MRFWIPARDEAETCIGIIENAWSGLIPAVGQAIGWASVLLVMAVWLALAPLIGVAKALRVYAADRRRCVKAIQRARANPDYRKRLGKIVAVRRRVFPWSRVYAALDRCVRNEAEKERRRILHRLRDSEIEDWNGEFGE